MWVQGDIFGIDDSRYVPEHAIVQPVNAFLRLLLFDQKKNVTKDVCLSDKGNNNKWYQSKV